MKLKTMSVTDLNTYIKRNFDNDFILSNLTLMGEISNFKAHSSGHLYFSLKDENSKINCVMFRSDASSLKIRPKDGMKVVVKGRVSVYTKEGSYQLYAQAMEEVGLGEIYLEFERNKERLSKEGLFSEDIKKPIPPYPEKVAIITSSTGAAIRDIINVSQRRNPSVSLVIYPTLVQGEESRGSLIDAMKKVNERDDIDVIILARGGGSYEDLSSFNDLNLAYAIRASKIPVVTGIGHEVDFTIADFVADLRCATPSQSAEVVVPSRQEMERETKNAISALKSTYSNKIGLEKSRLKGRLDILEKNNPKTLIINGYLEIDNNKKRLNGIIIQKLSIEKEKLSSSYELLKAYNPLNILDKGYSLIFDEHNQLIRSVDTLDKTDILLIKVRDGERTLEVKRNG
ncbi:MAG: exodeoxyribonuclease VII large subunit [Clostridiaceae bacterium]